MGCMDYNSCGLVDLLGSAGKSFFVSFVRLQCLKCTAPVVIGVIQQGKVSGDGRSIFVRVCVRVFCFYMKTCLVCRICSTPVQLVWGMEI